MELRSGKSLSSRAKRRRTTSDNWWSIPGDILGLIAGKFVSFHDYARFSAVCRSWHFHATDLYEDVKHKFIGPLYMSVIDPDSKRIVLANPASDATLVRDLPENAGSLRCWGSPFGWVVTYDHTNLQLSLVNPVTGATIPLPSLPKSTGYRESIKPFLTANPESDPDNCLVLITNTRSGSHSYESTTDFKLFKIDLSTGNLTQILSLSDHCLFLGNNYSSFKATYPPANLFEKPRHQPREFISNYGFYTYNCDGLRPWAKSLDDRRFDAEVWNMLTSTKVSTRIDSPTTLCGGPLWILPNPTLKLSSIL